MRLQKVSFHVLLVAVVALLAVGIGPAVPNAAAQSTPPVLPKPRLNWKPCYRETGYPFECATFRVPLNHSRPNGSKITIAMARLPASDPARKIGSLFLNPGGPGGSGVDFVLGVGPFLYSDEVRARFDLIGFDPRGIARSNPLRCYDTTEDALADTAPFAFPTTPAEIEIWRQSDLALVEACDQRAGRIIDNMSTADVARDLDLMRQAVGDAGLTYAGYSYGTYLGAVYANLFPDKVRAVVVDGVLDPVEWATGTGGTGTTVPFSVRIRSAAGAQATLNEFFRLCDAGGANCAFSGNSAARFAALAAQLRANPLTITLPDGTTITFSYASLIANALNAMYGSASWGEFAQFLAALEAQATPAERGASLQALWDAIGLKQVQDPEYQNVVEGFPGVACADTTNPTSFGAWVTAAAASEQQDGYFGPLWTWITSVCADWPGSQASRYTGPFTARTAKPVLVVGTRYDPATRYEGAQVLAGLLPNSSLLTVEGWGHTSLFLSQCADTAVSNYLLTSVPPASGTVCTQDVTPFTEGPGLARASSLRALVNDALIPQQVRGVK
ncbi:MAG TPA: alpha/beta hydrolase [Roseiflexaceae bacterium]|nr:alpha/beta hydrolase [Roseiflexaceae bacterium]